MNTPTPLAIYKAAVLTTSGLLLLAPLGLPFAGDLTFLCGLVVLASALACPGSAYKKPVYVFIGLSALAARPCGNTGAQAHYILLLVPPLLILLSATGVHPFISLFLIGKIFSPVLAMPRHEVLLALALLLGGSLSYILSPFAGTLLTLSSLAGCSPATVAKWNGPFTAIFLLQGLAVIVALQWLWR